MNVDVCVFHKGLPWTIVQCTLHFEEECSLVRYKNTVRCSEVPEEKVFQGTFIILNFQIRFDFGSYFPQKHCFTI